jgi:hypothetical protein
MTFEYWLKKYGKKDLAIADLLKDYEAICRQEKAWSSTKPKLTLEHLQNYDACDDAINTYHRARALYANDILSTNGRKS